MSSIAWERIPVFYHKYVQQVQEGSLREVLARHADSLPRVLGGLPEERWSHSYAPGKWSIKEVVQHIIDTERIFCYRALAFARGEQAALPGFDENAYAAAADANRRTGDDLLAEFAAVQQATQLMFASFSSEQLASVGTANGNPMYVAGIGYIIAGHCMHHLHILTERYLTTNAAQQGATA